jgi:phage terminase large subunit
MKIQLPKWAKRLFEPIRYKAPHGGRGAGAKSRSVATALLLIASQNRKRILCAREFQKSIKQSVHKLLKDQVERCDLQSAFVVTDKEIRGTNGSEFIFEGLHANISSIKSLENVDIVWVEEGETVSAESWRTLIPTIRKPGSEIWCTFNPRRESDATSQRFIVSPPKNCWAPRLKPGRSEDNPWFTDEMLEEMKHDFEVDPETAAHVWNGEYEVHANAQIFAGKTAIEEFEPTNTWSGPYYGLDFGFARDPLSAHEYWVTGDDNRLYVRREAWGINVELNDIPALLHRSFPKLRQHLVRADNSRPESISHLRGLGLNVVGAKKWPGSVEDGIAYLRSLDAIVIHPDCVNATREARLYSYETSKTAVDKNGQPLVLAKVKDAWNHFWDDCRYALEPAISAAETTVVAEHREPVSITPELDEYELMQPNFSTF